MPTKPPIHRPKGQPKRKPDTRPHAAARGYGYDWQRRRMDIYVRDGGRCRACLKVIGKRGEWHVDHIKPKAFGGTDERKNLQLLCASCHSIKTATEDGGFGRPSRYNG